MIDVLPDLCADYPDLVYVIAGGGTDAPRLAKKSAAAGLARQIVFTGLFDEASKPDLYNLADVYAMPSRGEGFGFVFLEAMASGVPVIGSKHDGGREALLYGKLGTLVDPSNPAEIRAAIADHLDHTSRGIPPGLEFFSFENFARRLHTIINAVAS